MTASFSPQTRRRAMAIGFGFGVCLVLLMAVEVLLRLSDFRFSPWYLAAPQFVAEKDGIHVRTAEMFVDAQPYGWPFCINQRFARAKAPDTLRIALVGESNVRNLGLAEPLAGDLQKHLSRPVEILNFGFAGCGSERVLLSVHEALEYQPDIVVIYAGHNEFVSVSNPAVAVDSQGRPLKKPALPDIRVLQFLAKQILTFWKPKRTTHQGYNRRYNETDKAEFYEVFRQNLSESVAAAQSRGVPVVLCTVAYNYASQPNDYPASENLQEALNWDESRLRAELRNEPGHALLEFLLGRRLLEAGKAAEAAPHLEEAFLRDLVPTRANSEINRLIRMVAEQKAATLVDIHAAVGKRATNSLPGHELFEDYCHLNNEGRRILMETVAPVVRQQLEKK